MLGLELLQANIFLLDMTLVIFSMTLVNIQMPRV
jgi:hypothetical protein